MDCFFVYMISVLIQYHIMRAISMVGDSTFTTVGFSLMGVFVGKLWTVFLRDMICRGCS